MSYSVMSYPAMSYPAMSYSVMSYLVIPHQLLSRKIFSVLAALWLAVFAGSALAAEQAFRIGPPERDLAAAADARSATIVLAGGCFWGVQGVFQHVKGVTSAVSGYAGGTAKTASYELVAYGRTDHAEAVEVTYDPQQISFGRILQIFFSVAHDPTQYMRQGPDIGAHYRSAIFPASDGQREIIEAYIRQLDASGAYPSRIVTRLEESQGFFPAEDYHQDYMTRNPNEPYIVINDRPKVDNLAKLFGDLYREKPVLVFDTP